MSLIAGDVRGRFHDESSPGLDNSPASQESRPRDVTQLGSRRVVTVTA